MNGTLIATALIAFAVVLVAGSIASLLVAHLRIETRLRGMTDDQLKRLFLSTRDGRQAGWILAEQHRRERARRRD